MWQAWLGLLVATRVDATQDSDVNMHGVAQPPLPTLISSSWSGPLCSLAQSSQGPSAVWFAVSAEKVFEDSHAPTETCGAALEVCAIDQGALMRALLLESEMRICIAWPHMAMIWLGMCIHCARFNYDSLSFNATIPVNTNRLHGIPTSGREFACIPLALHHLHSPPSCSLAF